MQMINLSKSEYKERQAKILPKLNEIHFGEVNKHENKMIMKRETKLCAFLGTNYQEYYVEEYIITLKKYIGSKLSKCTRNAND
ncbi:UNVERIFIED_ORG: hypothetical protein [Escherichia phage CMSTMSU]|nr:hypothetical protein [Escherichia coli]